MSPAAILDVDGTLVDTNYQHALAWYRAFREHELVLPIWRIHRHAVVLASSAKQDEVDHYLELLDAGELADGWTTSEDVEATEPEPDLVQAAVDKAGGDMAVMIGDSTWDCEAAKRAGLETLAVLTGGFSEQELRDAGAATVFHSIEQLLEQLDETPFGRS